MRGPANVLLATAIGLSAGCAELGYRDRVLHRVPSPDGRLVAVCQEVPMFDGPESELRLERPDGSVVRQLLRMGDAGGCSEVAWSPDGRLLAVLTSHVSDINIIDVGWAMSHPDERNAHWFRRYFTFSAEATLRRGTARRGAQLTFVSNDALEFQICTYSLAETQRRKGEMRCTEPPRPQRLPVPTPFVPNRPAWSPESTRTGAAHLKVRATCLCLTDRVRSRHDGCASKEAPCPM